MNIYLVEIRWRYKGNETYDTLYRLVKANDKSEAEQKCELTFKKFQSSDLILTFMAFEIIE